MSERRPFLEIVAGAVLRRPYQDAAGRKGLLGLLARPQRHVVQRHALTLPGWPRFPRPLRIAFLSDFHLGSHTGDVARLTAIADEVTALAPDLVLFGGDYVNMQLFGGGRVPPKIIAGILSRIAAPCGRFGVLGNHDYVYGKADVAAALRGAGIATLDHGRSSFAYENHGIDIVGLSDAHIAWPDGRTLLANLAPDRPTIVLTHDPAHFAGVPAGPFLTLAGHTHGGQIRLPGIGALTNASAAPMHWTHGLVVDGERHMIVTAGLGTSGVPLRIGVPPEFVVIDVTGP
ncbi:MAG: metallophosphoesterase [Xanthobacteraceae bacterium]|nr:metallophosphoesterase [Xanthobacteraceae bacterium]